ncbi:NRDE domain protein [Leptospira gomenensis]|uniref:NRDE domain protein n=1 Tax=Leptospira gomenensis TaxID=2484974 RepID=A0A5F1YKB6_9LEPT|nr:NRDE family protein [Leptospira gomenensis]TGK33333.1 NRDE domain protein [Leptospira gomenensis]TGK37372.1 NRDE domain protein [Leptospira gomenensis]TGK40561.1 NRDE domain protein [Leptospira gomenensis]TGK56483.1 NRDE domain protein [Leptospira gomenensis]
MCTAIIHRNVEQRLFGLGFNRDESVKRKPALPPTVFGNSPQLAIAPLDGDYGGTWIGANSSREIFCLLNYYEATLKLLRNPTSRGLLVRSCLLNEVRPETLQAERLADFYPFKLIRIDLDKTSIFVWDGKDYSVSENRDSYFILGSSFTQGPKAQISREAVFRESFLPQKPTDRNGFLDLSKRFLTAHLPEKGALSPCMHRKDAHTVSKTEVVIAENTLTLTYQEGQPCESPEPTSVNLTLTDFSVLE